ncbi:MAG: RNA polymerase sigma-54 factor [Dinoroseobacter sp.]|jgi:RNA polymerase sigma-54 factor
MKQSLNLKLAQQLSLTPQLKQSLKLLQLSSFELEQEIQIAIDNNPLLERVETPAPELPPNTNDLINADDPNEVAETSEPSIEITRYESVNLDEEFNDNFSKAFDSPRPNQSQTAPSLDQTYSEASNFLVTQNNLTDHLSWQIQMTNLSQRDKLIANTLLHSLDEEAYLRAELSEILDLLPLDLGIDLDEIHAVLSLIKTLDPIGVGAKDLQDRLSLLLEQIDPVTPGLELAKCIVNQHLTLLANRDLARLKQSLSVKQEELAISLRLITRLNPHIISSFTNDARNYLTPDIIIKKRQDIWVASLNSDNQFKLRVNEEYANLLKTKIDQRSSDYIQVNLTQAKIYIKSLLNRYDTLLLVAQAIVEHQSAFFEHGELAMKPLVLYDIAQQLEMHESTISRAISGKYLLAGGRVYLLKYFFSSALASNDGSSSSSTAIRSLIRRMVDQESKTKPLSDSKIAKKLEEKGLIVARRTVAKYRESMLIAPSSQRKKLS